MGVEMLQQYARGTGGPVAALAVIQLALTATVLTVGGITFTRWLKGPSRA
jgi:hypothetical protein